MLEPFDDVRVRDLILFDRVVSLGSISAAARELGVAKPTASRWLAQLEERVGHPLIHRTTRHVSLNERGRAFHVQVQTVLAVARQARIVAQSSELGGTLRVSLPLAMGRLIAGALIADYGRALPGVRLEIRLQNERAHLVRDQFDVAIRGGPLPDSDLIARRLAEVSLSLYASARYAGEELDTIPLISSSGDGVLLRGAGLENRPQRAFVDDRTAVADALIAGAGMAVLPSFLAEAGVESGALVCLSERPLARVPVHALYLPAQRRDERIQVFVELVGARLRPSFEGV